MLICACSCDKAGLGLGLCLGSRLGSRVLNNRRIILLTWLDLILGCSYKTKGTEKERKEKKVQEGRRGLYKPLDMHRRF